MKITFELDEFDYDEYIHIMRRDVAEDYEIKPGDILEEVQLDAYFIECLGKEETGKKTKELKQIKANMYSFSGEVTKIKKIRSWCVVELIVDCTLPVRMHLEGHDKEKFSELKIRKGDFIRGVFRLLGYICLDPYLLREHIKGKVLEIEKFEIPLANNNTTYAIFITLETID